MSTVLGKGQGFATANRNTDLLATCVVHRYALSGTEASGLWHAVRLVDNVGCSSVSIFGVPDPKACKRRKDDPTRSNYWAPWSAGQCSDGLDAGANHDPRLPDPLQLSLADRRALAGWTSSRTVRFDAPPWPSERG
ncbi:unnamed protein product [Ixodes persulcatus]